MNPTKLLKPWLALALFTLTACAGTEARDAQQSAPVAEANALPGPAMWRIQDEDTEIILFGTVHALSEDTDWRRPELVALLPELDALYIETNFELASFAEQREFNLSGKAAEGEKLEDLLSEEELDMLMANLPADAPPFAFINGRTPWFAALMISQLSMAEQGYLPENGVENQLMDALEQAGTPVRSLEAITATSRLLSALPQEVQIGLLVGTIEELDTYENDFELALDAWLSGDTDGLHEASMSDLDAELPEVYQAIIVTRNASWVPVIEDILATEEGVYLVAVGSAHLAGPDSLILMLKDEGLSPQRF